MHVHVLYIHAYTCTEHTCIYIHTFFYMYIYIYICVCVYYYCYYYSPFGTFVGNCHGLPVERLPGPKRKPGCQGEAQDGSSAGWGTKVTQPAFHLGWHFQGVALSAFPRTTYLYLKWVPATQAITMDVQEILTSEIGLILACLDLTSSNQGQLKIDQKKALGGIPAEAIGVRQDSQHRCKRGDHHTSML